MTRHDLMELLTELPYCVAVPGMKEIDGVGNYVVAIEKPRLSSSIRVTNFQE